MESTGLQIVAFSVLAITAASTTFLLLFSVASMMNGWPSTFQRLSLAATVISFIDLAWICGLLSFCPRGSLGLRHQSVTWIVFASIIIPVGAASSAIATLAWMKIHPLDAGQVGFGYQIPTLLHAEFGLWGASVLAQVAFYITLVRNALRVIAGPPVSRSTASIAIGTLKLDLSPRKTSQFSTPMRNLSPKTSPKRIADDFFVSRASQSSTEARKVEEVSDTQQDLASKWATSQPSIPQPVTPPQRQRLEPIPGSRSNSPARPLDGPFPGTALDETPIQSLQLSLITTLPDRPLSEIRVPPRFRKDSSTSHQTSTVIDESHIHPLFRTDSPLPPPTPTIGTSVIASAFGGQYMSARSISRASSRSRPTTPTDALSRESSRNRSRANSQTQLSNRCPNRNGSPTKLKARSMEAIRKPWSGEDGENIPPLPGHLLFSNERLSYESPT